MSTLIRNKKDALAGLLYIGVGVAFSYGARSYEMGKAADMGPAYLPFWLGVLLTGVGAVVFSGALRKKAAIEAAPRFDWKTLSVIILSLVVFGLLLSRLGLVISLPVLVLIASRASHEFGWKGSVLNALMLLVACVGTFVYGLGIQMRLWPVFMS